MSNGGYKDFSDKQLKFGLWLTKNRVVIKAALLSLGFLVVGIVLFFNIKSLIDFYSQQEIDRLNNQMLSQNVWETNYRDRYAAQPLTWNRVQVIPRTENSVDLLVEVSNTNTEWYVPELNYHFFMSGWQSEVISEYLLPGQTKKLVYINIDISDLNFENFSDLKAQVVVDNVNWQRVKDFTFYDSSGRFRNPELSALNADMERLGNNLYEFSFELTNNSIYNYRNVEALVVLMNSNLPVSVNVISVSELLSDESREVKVRWFGDLPTYNSFDIDVSTNLLDPENYMRFQLEQFQ